MTISNKIKRLRKAAKISQVELAKKLDTTKQTIYKYENGLITNIPSDKIEIMARLFGTTPQYLMGWESSNDIETDAQGEIEKIVNAANSNKDVKTFFTQVADMSPEDFETARKVIDALINKS